MALFPSPLRWSLGHVDARAAGLVLVIVWLLVSLALGPDVPGSVLVGAVLFVLFHRGVRRRPVRVLWVRDTKSFARGWKGKLLVAGVLAGMPALMTLQSYATDRWIDDSWTVLLMVGALATIYLAALRLLVTLVLASVVVVVAMAMLAPELSTGRNGDPLLLAQLADQERLGVLAGQHDLAVAEVDLNASRPVRLACIGAGTSSATPMEVGSLTTVMTGLVIADSVRRGEMDLNAQVSTYLPQLDGSRAGQVTMRELVTHTAGYANIGAASMRRALWTAPLGRGFLNADPKQMMADVRAGNLETRGTYVYSNLGAATAGQAVAAAAGMSFPELMRGRLFRPLRMNDTGTQTWHPLVAGGHSTSGLPIHPSVFDANAYAPAGAVVSTAKDLATLAAAILKGTAPGLDALTATTATDEGSTGIGEFWLRSSWVTGQTITWLDGLTAGYASYFGLDLRNRRAVIVLSDVGNPATTDLGVNLLAS